MTRGGDGISRGHLSEPPGPLTRQSLRTGERPDCGQKLRHGSNGSTNAMQPSQEHEHLDVPVAVTRPEDVGKMTSVGYREPAVINVEAAADYLGTTVRHVRRLVQERRIE